MFAAAAPTIVDEHSVASLDLGMHWSSDDVVHHEYLHVERFNVWRDLELMPAPLQGAIFGRAPGNVESHRFGAGEVLAAWDPAQVYTVAARHFRGHTGIGPHVMPRAGRYYPKGMVSGLPGVFSENRFPLRVLACGDDRLTVDLNHPLANRDLEMSVTLLSAEPAPEEHGGRCGEPLQKLFDGPGMQASLSTAATDFFSGNPFARGDEQADAYFYSLPRLVDHLDAEALAQVQRLYGELLPREGRILDLMSSANSHLPRELERERVHGLGMSAKEMGVNRALGHYVTHDLNAVPVLPYGDEFFSAVVCSLSVEYLTAPDQVFAEVARVLRPGGLFVNVFSNRWFPTKAIALWGELHEFERIGLVTEYYRRTARFEALQTYSMRGRPRPLHDRYAARLPSSDPVYAVSGRRL